MVNYFALLMLIGKIGNGFEASDMPQKCHWESTNMTNAKYNCRICEKIAFQNQSGIEHQKTAKQSFIVD